jgi:hypothetical protein
MLGISRLDWLVYRLFFWRWRKILVNRPDIRELMIVRLKTYDFLDDSEKIRVTVVVEKVNE